VKDEYKMGLFVECGAVISVARDRSSSKWPMPQSVQ